ncbi:glucose-specific phosphotransferase system IIA component [Desulfohalotomaculum tongense]|uniref:PTS sugar transporter subunit IIA n=1 Tax=Desulforadius tongensis TaxID=1216062 RepID=UPI001EE54005|nr:glucose PTS transporter subunit IIA [Desulforadius tongensis]MBM7855591.1 glucose-specific phosphotransferase system IIA component [Desulforadius tongensis]
MNLKTPGREDKAADEANQGSASDLAHKVLEALGGANNIDVLDACITRLRVTVKDPALVKKDTFSTLGAAGVMEMGKNLQIIFGTQSDSLKEEIRSLMGNQASAAGTEAKSDAAAGHSDTKTIIKAPASGRVTPLNQLSDKTFSQKMLGNGVAIEPVEGTFVAPVSGTVVQLFPTHHALTIKTESGLEVLIHVGINTVSLKGRGFKALVAEGQKVEAGQKLLEVDLQQIKDAGLDSTTPVIVIGVQEMEITPAGEVTAGEDTILQIGG